ncbi:uncharacterized protein LOC101456268 [Ceratitis capitata]|uniref:uncharacterized protein LOC101456268 n=1 Tax=Ceratitis capitata TaxID=7213 RepID=UPI00032A0397|nr:uncharacterized protein LOC101456268 [Ceratitis capitata]
MKCELCGSDKLDSIRYGEFLTKNGKGVHTNCLYLSSGMNQNGKDDEGILGFLIKDIAVERKRVSTIQCYYCGEMSANIGCCEKRCYRNFHMICGMENGAMNQYLDTYRSFCHKHVRKTQSRPKRNDDCGICYENIFNGSTRFSSVNMLRATCCRNGWFHKYCLQKFAKMAGYFFKCPLCNDCQKFKKDMSFWGIFIHDKDADWELVPNAFAELLERPSVCEAVICRNAEGRRQKKISNPFIFCSLCGSVAIHRLCLTQKANSFECDSCKNILNAVPILSSIQQNQHNVEESEQNTECSDVDVCGNTDDEYLSCDDFTPPSSKKMSLNQIINEVDNDEYENVKTDDCSMVTTNTSCIETDHSYACDDEIVLNVHENNEDQEGVEKNIQQIGSFNNSYIAQISGGKSMAMRSPAFKDNESEANETSFTHLNYSSEKANSTDNGNTSNFVMSDHSYACIELSDDDNDDWANNTFVTQQNTINIEKFQIDDKASVANALATKSILSDSEAQAQRTSLSECPPSIKYDDFEADHMNTFISSCQSNQCDQVFHYDDGNDTENEDHKGIAKASHRIEESEPKTINAMDMSCIANRTRRRSSFKNQISNIGSSLKLKGSRTEIVDEDHSSMCSADSYQAHRQEDNVVFDYEADEDSEAETGRRTDEEKRLRNYFHRLLHEVKRNTKLNNILGNVDTKTDEKNIVDISCIANRTRRRSVKVQKSTLPTLEVTVEKPIQLVKHTLGNLTDSHTFTLYNDKSIDNRDANCKADSAVSGNAEHKNRVNAIRSKQRGAQKRKSDLHANIPAKMPLMSNTSNNPKVATNILEVSCIASRTRRKSVDAKTYLNTIIAREKTKPCTTNTERNVPTKAYNSLSSCESSSNDLSTESAMCDNSIDCVMPRTRTILPIAETPSRRKRTAPRRFLDSGNEYDTHKTKMPKLANWANVKETVNAYVMPRYKRVNGKLKRETAPLPENNVALTRKPFAHSYELLLGATDVDQGAKSARA